MSAMTALAPVGGVGATRVRVHAPFDLRHSADLRQEFIRAIREGNDLLVDISESTVVDQVGFATLVGAHARAARAGRRLRFTGADERTTRLLRRAGLARLLAETPAPAVALRRSRSAVG
ncbi:STAS domain-containing protein [Janibacter hoylei]|uniref:STAS domain-containing protein n=1 Tax=Janibacter hoylei TaxID=364298 RepID=UPI0021A56078|nr:STAS domain-containing protein [Janibacter hoylei]MCT2293140.1 STAS domain-containing protein [Janibacter hoylei]MCW4602592.1 STAS domain-containing protein [Janibacter hoylei]